MRWASKGVSTSSLAPLHPPQLPVPALPLRPEPLLPSRHAGLRRLGVAAPRLQLHGALSALGPTGTTRPPGGWGSSSLTLSTQTPLSICSWCLTPVEMNSSCPLPGPNKAFQPSLAKSVTATRGLLASVQRIGSTRPVPSGIRKLNLWIPLSYNLTPFAIKK